MCTVSRSTLVIGTKSNVFKVGITAATYSLYKIQPGGQFHKVDSSIPTRFAQILSLFCMQLVTSERIGFHLCKLTTNSDSWLSSSPKPAGVPVVRCLLDGVSVQRELGQPHQARQTAHLAELGQLVAMEVQHLQLGEMQDHLLDAAQLVVADVKPFKLCLEAVQRVRQA